MLDVKAEGNGTESSGQLLPQQDLLQLRRGSVLVEGEEDGLLLSRIGRLLNVHRRDSSSGLWAVDSTGGRRRLSGGLHRRRGADGVLGGG